MNIAVSTVVIFLFLVPGILFRKFYYSDEFSGQYFKESFLGIVLSSFLPSLVIQYLWSAIVEWTTSTHIELSVIFDLITTSPVSQATIINLQANASSIFAYNATMFFLSSLAGWTTRILVRFGGIDRKYAIFRFKNHWHYVLSGEFFEIPRASFDLQEDDVSDIEVIYIDALIETKEGTVIYDGILVNYELTSDGGGLEYIVLKEVERRYMKDDALSDNLIETSTSTQPITSTAGHNPYYSIPGHIMVIPYSSIINLNVTYYRIEEEIQDDKFMLNMIQVS